MITKSKPASPNSSTIVGASSLTKLPNTVSPASSLRFTSALNIALAPPTRRCGVAIYKRYSTWHRFNYKPSFHTPTGFDKDPPAQAGATGDDMKRSTDRILTTHVGSLIRPLNVLRGMMAKVLGEPVDEA